MSKEIESISSALFDKIRSRFANITLGDEKAKAETDPTKARFFNFTYSSEDGAEFGTVTISLIDETSLKVYYGQSISNEMDREQRKEWYEFLRNLRQFAKRNLLTFDTRDITKSNLNLKDVKQQAKADDVYTTAEMPVTESKLALAGTSRNTYANVGECRLMIRHEGLVNDDIRGARTRHIKEIFIETARGERFLLNHTNLHGAVAMANHINAGGEIHDEIAESIDNMVNEMNCMKHFVRSAKRRQFEDQETADMTQAAIRHYDEVKNRLKRLRSRHYYDQYVREFAPQASANEVVDVDSLKERFVKKVYDARFDEALPIVYREYKRQQASKLGSMGNELDEWATDVTESTWAKPDSADKITALRELLKTPIPCGIEGIDAQTKIEPIIGDDKLTDDIFQLAQSQGPDADATNLVKQWLVQNMPSLLKDIEIGQANNRDQQTNWAQPTSPQTANHETGVGMMSAPVAQTDNHVREDSLDFIRSLAGLR